MTKKLLEIFGFSEEMIEKVQHRLGHDFRYSINGEKLKKLGFEHKHKNIDEELKKLVEWYRQNENWWRSLK
jgi:dTDP-glucose 4,6-dehydratase